MHLVVAMSQVRVGSPGWRGRHCSPQGCLWWGDWALKQHAGGSVGDPLGHSAPSPLTGLATHPAISPLDVNWPEGHLSSVVEIGVQKVGE